MLNGIGGRTVAEALAALTVRELDLWRRYRAKHGSLNPADRNEYMLARLSLLTATAHGAKNLDLYDFAPSLERPEPEAVEFGDALARAGHKV